MRNVLIVTLVLVVASGIFVGLTFYYLANPNTFSLIMLIVYACGLTFLYVIMIIQLIKLIKEKKDVV